MTPSLVTYVTMITNLPCLGVFAGKYEEEEGGGEEGEAEEEEGEGEGEEGEGTLVLSS